MVGNPFTHRKQLIHSLGFIPNLGSRAQPGRGFSRGLCTVWVSSTAPVGGRLVASNGVGWTGRIETVFDELVTGDQVAGADDGALIDAITGWARAEATVTAHRLAAIAELAGRRCGAELAASREQWACDGWDSAAAEIAAALRIGHRAAGTQMLHALRLRDRLPRVGALLAAGMITAATAAHRRVAHPAGRGPAGAGPHRRRTGRRRDPIRGAVGGPIETAIDTIIVFHDPAAVRRFHSAARGRDITIGDPEDPTGTTSIWGRLHATDAELLKRRLDALAHSVCPADPRTLGERRSDALGILSAHGDRLPCRCENPDCPAAGPDARAERIVIHVLTDAHPTPRPTPPFATPPRPRPLPHPTPEPHPNPDPTADPTATAGVPVPSPTPTIPARAIPRRRIPARTAAPSTATPTSKRKSDPTPPLNPVTPLPCPKPTLRPRSPPPPPLGPPAAPPPR